MLLWCIDFVFVIDVYVEFVVFDKKMSGVLFVYLFCYVFGIGIVLLWILNFMNLFVVYFFVNWFLMIMNGVGYVML